MAAVLPVSLERVEEGGRVGAANVAPGTDAKGRQPLATTAVLQPFVDGAEGDAEQGGDLRQGVCILALVQQRVQARRRAGGRGRESRQTSPLGKNTLKRVRLSGDRLPGRALRSHP